jgi:hypothetical protein
LPVNFPDFSIELPLDDGENDFTLLGEPGPITWSDDYQRFVLNLYFDGSFDAPGISVLFPRFAPPEGAPPSENRAPDAIYSFDLALVQAEPSMVYDDGVSRVSVSAVSFLPPERFVSVNLVDRYTLAPGGQPDGIGTLRLFVEPSTGERPVVGPGPTGFGPLTGGQPAVPVVRPGFGGGAVPSTGGLPRIVPQAPAVHRPYASQQEHVDDHGSEFHWFAGDSTIEEETPETTPSPEETASSVPTSGAPGATPTPTRKLEAEPTPTGTGEVSPTPTPAATGSGATQTPAPSRTLGRAAKEPAGTPSPIAAASPQPTTAVKEAK